MKARFSTLLFDLDGTLVDSYAALATALNATAVELGLPVRSPSEIIPLVGEGIERLIEKAFGECSADALARFDRHYDLCCEEETTLLPHVGLALRELGGAGYLMGVCTNKSSRFASRILRSLDLAQFFPVVSGPDVTGFRKPDPEHVIRTIEALGSRPSETLFIGDMPIDIRAARGAGCAAAAVPSPSASAEVLAAEEPDILLDSLGDLPGFLASLREVHA